MSKMSVKQRIRNPKYLNADGSFIQRENGTFFHQKEGFTVSKEDAWITLNEYEYSEDPTSSEDGDLFVYGKLKDKDAVDTNNLKNGAVSYQKLSNDVRNQLVQQIEWENLSNNLQQKINQSGGILIGPRSETETSFIRPKGATNTDLFYAKLWIETETVS